MIKVIIILPALLLLQSSEYDLLTPAEVAELCVLFQYLIWCGAQAASASALALLLLAGPARRALACVTLSASAGAYWKIVRGIAIVLAASNIEDSNGSVAIVATLYGAIVVVNFTSILYGEE